MKRQLNFWTKMRGLPDKDLINISLSIEDKKFTITFRRPGSVKPIDQIVVDLSDDEAIEMKHTFELCGASVFETQMDENIYFANIARSRESVKYAENVGISVGWATATYLICMVIFGTLTKVPIIFVFVISLFIAIMLGIFLKKNVYKET